MRRLICAFAVRISHKQVFSWHGSTMLTSIDFSCMYKSVDLMVNDLLWSQHCGRIELITWEYRINELFSSMMATIKKKIHDYIFRTIICRGGRIISNANLQIPCYLLTDDQMPTCFLKEIRQLIEDVMKFTHCKDISVTEIWLSFSTRIWPCLPFGLCNFKLIFST